MNSKQILEFLKFTSGGTPLPAYIDVEKVQVITALQ